jgi:hypothetical protein
MNRYILQQFDEDLNLDALEEFYDGEITIHGHDVELELNFDEISIGSKRLELLSDFIKKIAEFDTRAIQAIRNDFKAGESVKEYINEVIQDLDSQDLDGILQDPEKMYEQKLLQKFYLKKIAFFPENKEQFAFFDYTIGEEITNYLIVISFSENGEIEYIIMEN